jgi:hypothetical protein
MATTASARGELSLAASGDSDGLSRDFTNCQASMIVCDRNQVVRLLSTPTTQAFKG